jgi:hypothetical protein
MADKRDPVRQPWSWRSRICLRLDIPGLETGKEPSGQEDAYDGGEESREVGEVVSILSYRLERLRQKGGHVFL